MELAKSTKLGSCGEADLLVQKLVRKQDKFFPGKTIASFPLLQDSARLQLSLIMQRKQYSRRQLLNNRVAPITIQM